MRIRRDKTSPWGKRLWIEDHDFEQTMDDLRAKLPNNAFSPGSGVDVEAILEQVLEVDVDYCDLEAGVLGKTRFLADGRVEVCVSRWLADAADKNKIQRRRFRATLAHEASHVIYHRRLYLDSGTGWLFAPKSEDPQIMCREERIEGTPYDGEWWEFQANQGMSCLLLPRPLLLTEFEEALERRGFDSIEAVAGEERALTRLVGDLVDVFDVSMTMMIYRLQALNILPKDGAVQRQLVVAR